MLNKYINEGFIFWGVDLQNDFMDKEGKAYIPQTEEIKPTIKNLVREIRKLGQPIFGSRYWHSEEKPFCVKESWGAKICLEAKYGFAYPITYSDSTEITKVMEKFEKTIDCNSLLTFTKTTTDIFREVLIDKYVIPRLKGKTIIVYGVDIENSVRATVLGFLDRGFKVIIVEDAIAGSDDEIIAETLIELQLHGAVLMTLIDLIIYVSRESILMRLRNAAKFYILSYGLKSIVLGVSGGIDSALTAAILSPVCKELDIPLIGVWIGIKSFRQKPSEAVREKLGYVEASTDEEHVRAQNIGKEFCDEFYDIDLTEPYLDLLPFMTNSMDTINAHTQIDKIRRGNIKARLRMIYLYNLAHERGGIVMSTDNMTEYKLGFWTLHGDVGDLNLLSGLYKTELYEVASFEVVRLEQNEQEDKGDALMACITAKATDGLGISESDNDQLAGCDFDEIDKVLIDVTDKNSDSDYLDHPITLRWHNTKWKRKNPVNISREFTMGGTFFNT